MSGAAEDQGGRREGEGLVDWHWCQEDKLEQRIALDTFASSEVSRRLEKWEFTDYQFETEWGDD